MNKWLYKNGWWMLFALLAGCSDDKKDDMVLPVSTLTISPETEIVFQQAGETSALNISTNRNWVVTKGEGIWYGVDGNVTGEPGEYTVNVVTSDNTGIEKRESKIVVQAGTEKKELNIIQFGSEPDFTLPEKEISMEYTGGEREFVVNSNTEVEISTADAWIGLSAKKYAMDNSVSNVYRVYCMQNEGEKRTGKVTVKVGSKEDHISFVQEAWQAEIVLEREEVVIGGMRELCETMLQVSGDWTIEYEGGSKPEWIKSAPQGGNKGSVVLSFKLSPNQEMTQRTCVVLIRCGGMTKRFTIVQLPVLQRERDSLVLQTIYQAATSHGTTTWDFNQPISTWEGVTLTDGRVTYLRFLRWTFNEIPAALGKLDVLEDMTFAYCQFSDPMLPDEVGNWTALKVFTCIGEQSVHFPETVKGWNNLGTLAMSGDVFQDMTLKGAKLEEVLCTLPTLHTISFMHTDLKELPEALSSSKVKIITVEYAELSTIPESLGEMPNLTYLTIRYCPIKGDIPGKLFDAPLLKSCNLSHNKFTGSIPDNVFTAPNLYELILADNNLEGDLSVAIVDSGIQMFDVCLNKLGGQGKVLDERIKGDVRFGDARAWNGLIQICMQQDGYGWSNCDK